jgi:CxxC motif-containing protein (DUF1111 family)
MQVMRSAMRLGGALAWMTWCLGVVQPIGGSAAAADPKLEKPDPVATGYEIFNREWMPNDPRSHGGDGLGPVYNDSSCVACHNAGGSGGAGPVSKNIEILSASPDLGMALESLSRSDGKPASANPLADLHAGFKTSRTVVLHKFGTDPNYDAWRSQALKPRLTPVGNETVAIPGPVPSIPMVATSETRRDPFSGRSLSDLIGPAADRAAERLEKVRSAVLARLASDRQPPLTVGTFAINRSQRNPTPLFGLGLIDAIPDEAIVAMEKQQAGQTSMTGGRVSRVKDGRIGRLGWKGQIANVEDFVLNACAVEVGLEVPGHHQAVTPQAPKYRATGLDLTADECSALVAYVKSLPRPVERPTSTAAEAKVIDAGRATFATVGCASCHTPDLGKVQGIHSDLLLHDMGGEMGDVGSYGVDSSDDGSDEPASPPIAADVANNSPAACAVPRTRRGASRQEWKTPPLWGFRDSGPYLHDGRAQTLEEAVAMHGGQGAFAAQAYFQLPAKERQQLEVFLKSLVAPSSPVKLARGD